jgi:hypothetical protein
MSFNPRRFVSQTSPTVLERHIRAQWPQLAVEFDWTAPELNLRSSVPRSHHWTAGETNGILASLERMHLMANEAGDRAMTAACSENLDLSASYTCSPAPGTSILAACA